jgi:hypothetical protein
MLDWEQITTIPREKMIRAIGHQWGEDYDEIRSRITLAIAERAAEVPDFLDHTDGYIRTWAKWRIRDQYLRRERKEWLAIRRYTKLIDKIDGEEPRFLACNGHMPTPGYLDAINMIQMILDHPDKELRAVMEILLSDPEGYIHRHNGCIVINREKLSNATGKSNRWVRYRLLRIRAVLRQYWGEN